ncbi:hypothetical protein Barb7_01654 [Bacteroidales bacterium Barb7]|nr:hypothetical protein Barb7_01654 [Bacteroidales bacterium Barb7]
MTDTITSSPADIQASAKLDATRLIASVVPRVSTISCERLAFRNFCTVFRASSCASVANWLRK